MKPSDFAFASGSVVYWDFDDVRENDPLDSQLSSLKEDLKRVVMSPGIILDVGWYPECSADGTFVVFVVQDGGWKNPVLRLECGSIPALQEAIRRGAEAATGRLARRF